MVQNPHGRRRRSKVLGITAMIQDTRMKAWLEKLDSMNPDEHTLLIELRKEPSTIRELSVRLG
jgi:hypothetical protein